MTDPLKIMYEAGRRNALALREAAADLTGTAIIAREEDVPDWDNAADYTQCPPGTPVSHGGQIWLLLIPHHAAAYPGVTPSGNRACWGLAHTTDPTRAKPWVAPYGTSGLYREGECCRFEGAVWRNLFEGNPYAPNTPGAENRWEEVVL